jgi:hypothetical protein
VEGAHLVHFGRDFRLPRLSVLTLVDDLSIGYTPPGCLVQKRIPTEVQSFHDVLAEFKYFDSLNSSQLTTTHFDVDWFLESVPVTDGMVRELQPARQVQDIHAIHTQTLSLSLSLSPSLSVSGSLSLSLSPALMLISSSEQEHQPHVLLRGSLCLLRIFLHEYHYL